MISTRFRSHREPELRIARELVLGEENLTIIRMPRAGDILLDLGAREAC